MKLGHLLVMSLLITAPRAAAGEPTRSDKDVARDIARRGAEYFDEGDWERAREHFRRAFEIVRAPTLALMEARSLERMGRLVEAVEAYVRASNGSLERANEAYRKAAAQARDELAALRPKVPSLRMVVPGDGAAMPEVRLDGAPIFDFSAPIPMNPGTHVVEVLRPGAPESWQSVSLSEGEQRTLWIDSPAPLATALPARTSPSIARPLMWTAFGVGAAGMMTGFITGSLASDRKATLDRDCAGAACPASSESDQEAYDHLRTASIVGYVSGIAGIGTGAIILALTPQKAGDARKVSANVSSSLSGIVVAGTF